MSATSDLRPAGEAKGRAAKTADHQTKKRRNHGLKDGLAELGAHGEGNLARLLSHPLADYYLVLVSAALLVGLGSWSSYVWASRSLGVCHGVVLRCTSSSAGQA